jgi:hypothetical protein
VTARDGHSLEGANETGRQRTAMQTFVRILLGLAGILSIVLALRFLQNPEPPAASLGVVPQSALGTATLRGDFGGLFGVCGIFALAAAIRNAAPLVTAPLLAIGIALAGRCISYALDGGGMASVRPMLIEAALVFVFALGRATLAPGK